MYRLEPGSASEAARAPVAIRLLGSGAILREVLQAAVLLRAEPGLEVEVWSVTSFAELARDAREVERWNRLHPLEPPRISHLERSLEGPAPVIATSDYVRAYPQLIAEYVGSKFVTLGTDGFGRSDTRVRLRKFFEVDRYQIAVAALEALVRQGTLPRNAISAAIDRYGIDANAPPPWNL
jgi:pyruvate dehydrogenase E1 component